MSPTARIKLLARACLTAALLTGVGLVLVTLCHTVVWAFANVDPFVKLTLAAFVLTLILGALTLAQGRGVPENERSRRLARRSMIAAAAGCFGYLFIQPACYEVSTAGARTSSQRHLQQIGMAFLSHR